MVTLNQEEFTNIFLGMGDFHMEKIVLSCIGQVLKESGIEEIFIENEIFGMNVVKSVEWGSLR